MIKIEAHTLEHAYAQAAAHLECSVTELEIEIVQHPKKGLFRFFQKKAIIVATCKRKVSSESRSLELLEGFGSFSRPNIVESKEKSVSESGWDDTQSTYEGLHMEALEEIKRDINMLFATLCFKIDPIAVTVYDDQTLLVEINGEDAALLIGKEGYRYKALSYMIFNWINAKYRLQLRLEIAEFLKNQEEAIGRYLESVYESIDSDGRAQTKVLDGVLVQIALRELRARYPQKYVAIRSTRDGAKFIVINDYYEH
ncbi:MAG: Jag N-terminal domain-containing protein [Campylobacterales bacterium]|nr:Jag N-terminal domain-containing protein [Campylobacterales bacterium]